jgi:hypothetical protein
VTGRHAATAAGDPRRAGYRDPVSELVGELTGPLAVAGRKPEPAAGAGPKKNYAERFSRALAQLVGDRVRAHFPKARVTPWADGSGQEYIVGGALDRKKTDVGVWDDAAGLILGASIKTYSFRDWIPAKGVVGRYSKNVKRNDMELRDEADVLHRRQPYAVLFALFFLPEDACWDGVTGHSSFAQAVFTLRKRAGRARPDSARYDLFERVFIGLYDEHGHVRFFDVLQAPPRNQPPRDTISLDELVAEMVQEVALRNGGARGDERFAPEDPAWAPPVGSLPAGLVATDEPEEDSALLY